MPPETGARPRALSILAGVYLLFLLLSATSYGSPFPFLGSFYTGRAGEALVLADCLVSLYLVIGILKRQRLTFWLLIFYNTLDIASAGANLLLVPAQDYQRLAGITIPQDELRLNTLVAAGVLVLLNLYLCSIRRHFDNRSPYLF